MPRPAQPIWPSLCAVVASSLLGLANPRQQPQQLRRHLASLAPHLTSPAIDTSFDNHFVGAYSVGRDNARSTLFVNASSNPARDASFLVAPGCFFSATASLIIREELEFDFNFSSLAVVLLEAVVAAGAHGQRASLVARMVRSWRLLASMLWGSVSIDHTRVVAGDGVVRVRRGTVLVF